MQHQSVHSMSWLISSVWGWNSAPVRQAALPDSAREVPVATTRRGHVEDRIAVRQHCWSSSRSRRVRVTARAQGRSRRVRVTARRSRRVRDTATEPRSPPLADPQQPVLIMLSQRQRLTTGTVELAPASSKPPTERYRQVCHELHTGWVTGHAPTPPPTVQAVARAAQPGSESEAVGLSKRLPSPLAQPASEGEAVKPSRASPPH